MTFLVGTILNKELFCLLQLPIVLVLLLEGDNYCYLQGKFPPNSFLKVWFPNIKVMKSYESIMIYLFPREIVILAGGVNIVKSLRIQRGNQNKGELFWVANWSVLDWHIYWSGTFWWLIFSQNICWEMPKLLIMLVAWFGSLHEYRSVEFNI